MFTPSSCPFPKTYCNPYNCLSFYVSYGTLGFSSTILGQHPLNLSFFPIVRKKNWVGNFCCLFRFWYDLLLYQYI